MMAARSSLEGWRIGMRLCSMNISSFMATRRLIMASKPQDFTQK